MTYRPYRDISSLTRHISKLLASDQHGVPGGFARVVESAMPTPRLEFCLLGPLGVRCGATVVVVPPGKQRAVLAALLLNAGRVVSLDELAEALWGSRPPPSARVTVQNYVMRLRKALGNTGRSRISTRPSGYVIHVDADELDVSRFEALLRAARAAAKDGAWEAAAQDADAALALWQGEPLADVGSEPLTVREVPRLAELRLQALEARIDAGLHLGRHGEVVAELRHLAGLYPLRERLHALLMLALYRDGRQGEALAAYQHARDVLIELLGAEPGAELRELHQRVLTADPSLRVAERPAASRTDPVVPQQLPAPPAHFVGRAAELSALTSLLDRAGAGQPGPALITAIDGAAGVGKTALAVHWAHRVADRFADGQLYVNLRGYDPGQPVSASDALAGFLRALGVPAADIPAETGERAALYRSLLAGRRVLVVLDNASDTDQVRPLLLGTPTARVLVTSRNDLAGLIVADGAFPLTLDVLTDADAYRLIAARVGPARLAAEPQAARALVSLCGRLPLALAIAAARAAAHPSFPLTALAAELRDAHGRLDALSTGEPATDVRAVFSWSYDHLPDTAARMFRLLALHPGPHITAEAAASLGALAVSRAHRLLRELTRGHMLTEPAPGRYALHDLLRAYATEQASATDAPDDIRAAIGRVLDHYLHTAHAGALILKPPRPPISLPASAAGVTPERLTSYEQAMAWFAAEHHVLLASVRLAVANGFDIHAWQLPWAMGDYQIRCGHWHEGIAAQRTAFDAAQRLGDQAGQAVALLMLGVLHGALGDAGQAQACLADSLQRYRQLGDRSGEARVHQSLGTVLDAQGRYADALRHAEQALLLFREIGDRAGQAGALNDVGWWHALLGDYGRAREFSRQALALQHELGNRLGEAIALDSVGYAEHHLGRLAEAAACYERSLGIFRALGQRYCEAATLTNLGDTRQADGDHGAARDSWQQALAILTDLHHRQADQVRDRLSRASAPAASVAGSPRTGARSA
jgi:DNA-binding SARP family transcriptional activator